MSAQIVSNLIAALGAILVAGATYLFTKYREREAAWRKEKLDHYKAFTDSLSDAFAIKVTPEGRAAFICACNNLNLIASQKVIAALQSFQEATKDSSTASVEERNAQMSKLFYELRCDLGISSDDPSTFKVGLWSSTEASRRVR